MGHQAGIIIRNVKNGLFHSANRLILNEVKGIECLLLSKEKMIECKNVVGVSPYLFAIDQIEATDIDNPIDFFIAENLYRVIVENNGKLE